MAILSEDKASEPAAARESSEPDVGEREAEYVPRDIPTETAAIVIVRTMQGFFGKLCSQPIIAGAVSQGIR